VSFANSGSKAAQRDLLMGLAQLHNFEYWDAAAAFQRAQKADPSFAMAYWGEAMTATHPVWNQQDMAAGRAALAKLGATPAERAKRAGNRREKAWLAAAEILYGEGSKPERDARFADAMEKMSRKYRKDDEAKLFHALALLGLAQGERDLPNFLKAAAIAQAVYRRNPLHPGAAHYWIHGMDDPEHAAGALEAARSLSKIAPGAGHAQHMTAHIFMALGMWNDVVAANETAEQVVREQAAAAGRPGFSCGHYAEWLDYGYFQQGRHDKALKLLAACEREGPDAVAWFRKNPGQSFGGLKTPDALRDRIAASLILMRGTAAVESSEYRKKGAVAKADVADLGRQSGWAMFARGLAQARNGDRKGASKTLARLRALIARGPEPDEPPSTGKYLQIMELMLDGSIRHQAKDVDGGLERIAQASTAYDAMPFDFGPPAPLKPPHELAGEILLAARRPQQALQEFDLALKWAPRRALSMLGRARALMVAGDKAAATEAYEAVASLWEEADPDQLANLGRERKQLAR
jgi:tetratricopeptide (TPR) repeat protein